MKNVKKITPPTNVYVKMSMQRRKQYDDMMQNLKINSGELTTVYFGIKHDIWLYPGLAPHLSLFQTKMENLLMLIHTGKCG